MATTEERVTLLENPAAELAKGQEEWRKWQEAQVGLLTGIVERQQELLEK